MLEEIIFNIKNSFIHLIITKLIIFIIKDVNIILTKKEENKEYL